MPIDPFEMSAIGPLSLGFKRKHSSQLIQPPAFSAALLLRSICNKFHKGRARNRALTLGKENNILPQNHSRGIKG